MAFSWILGRRFQPDEEGFENGTNGSRQQANTEGNPNRESPISLADIQLSIEDGLVMAFGPLGDPIPPHLLKDACAGQPRAKLRLPDGTAVDHGRLIKVLEAQQRHPLAEGRSDGWVAAMLGVAGAFEPTPSELLAGEESEGRRGLGGSLTLGVAGGETITICDAHPGDAESGPRAQLTIDDRPVSIEDVLCRSDRGEASDGIISIGLKNSADQRLSIILPLNDDAEAQLEAASDVWAGEPKVDLFLSGGRLVSIDDLTALLQGEPTPCSRPKKGAAACSYPLLGADEPAFDLERASIVMVTDMPDGWSLTAGMQSEQGAWILDPPDLLSASVRVSGPHEGPVSLNIKVISIVGHDGALVKQSRAVVVPAIERNDAGPSSSSKEQHTTEPGHALSSTTPLTFERAERRQVDGADALFLRGLPKEMSLSAGTFDPSLQGWILKPDQLDGLAIQVTDDGAERIVVKLTAIYLEGDGRSRAEAIITKTIVVGPGSSEQENMVVGASF